MKLKVKRTDNPTSAKAYVGVDRELTMDLSRRTISIHDGVSPGGAIKIGSALYNSGRKPVLSSLYSQSDFTATYLKTGNLVMGLVKPDMYDVEIAISTTADLDATAEILKMGMRFIASEGAEGAYTTIPLEIRPETAYIRGVGATASAYANDAVGVDTLYIFARYVDGVEVSDWSEPVVMSRTSPTTVSLGVTTSWHAEGMSSWTVSGLYHGMSYNRRYGEDGDYQIVTDGSLSPIGYNKENASDFPVNKVHVISSPFTSEHAVITNDSGVMKLRQFGTSGPSTEWALPAAITNVPVFSAKAVSNGSFTFVTESGLFVRNSGLSIQSADLKVDLDGYLGLNFGSNYALVTAALNNAAMTVVGLTANGQIGYVTYNAAMGIAARGLLSGSLGASFIGATVPSVTGTRNPEHSYQASVIGSVGFADGASTDHVVLPFIATVDGVNHYMAVRIKLANDGSLQPTTATPVDFFKLGTVSGASASSLRDFSMALYDPSSKFLLADLGTQTTTGGIGELATDRDAGLGFVLAANFNNVNDGDDLGADTKVNIYTPDIEEDIAGLNGERILGVGRNSESSYFVIFYHMGEGEFRKVVISAT